MDEVLRALEGHLHTPAYAHYVGIIKNSEDLRILLDFWCNTLQDSNLKCLKMKIDGGS